MTIQKILIRDETKDDAAVITEVTVAAFESMEISSHTEQFIIEALRSAKALTLSLVAEVDGRVVGHIAFSPVAISDGTKNWYGLGPVSVLPMYQRMGIGKALIREGLSRLKDLGAKGAVWSGIPNTTGNLDLRMLPDWSTRAFHKRCFSLFRLTAASRTVLSPSMKDSKPVANQPMRGKRIRPNSFCTVRIS